jgi:hypothetical protein
MSATVIDDVVAADAADAATSAMDAKSVVGAIPAVLRC